MEGESARDVYTPSEAERIMSRTGKPLTERRIRQMLQAGELEGYRDESGRWHVLQVEIHRLRDERPKEPERPPGAPESPGELLEVVRALEREVGRLEGRLELTETTESTLREQLDRECERADRLEEEHRRLVERLEVEQRRGFWSRLFGR